MIFFYDSHYSVYVSSLAVLCAKRSNSLQDNAKMVTKRFLKTVPLCQKHGFLAKFGVFWLILHPIGFNSSVFYGFIPFRVVPGRECLTFLVVFGILQTWRFRAVLADFVGLSAVFFNPIPAAPDASG